MYCITLHLKNLIIFGALIVYLTCVFHVMQISYSSAVHLNITYYMFQGLILHGLRHGGKAQPKLYVTEAGQLILSLFCGYIYFVHTYEIIWIFVILPFQRALFSQKNCNVPENAECLTLLMFCSAIIYGDAKIIYLWVTLNNASR